jgi:hypothetical protein
MDMIMKYDYVFDEFQRMFSFPGHTTPFMRGIFICGEKMLKNAREGATEAYNELTREQQQQDAIARAAIRAREYDDRYRAIRAAWTAAQRLDRYGHGMA